MSKPKRPAEEVQLEIDLRHLMAQPGFRRFLLRVYLSSGMSFATRGTDGLHLHELEGSRNLGFEIFSWCDDALSLPERTTLRRVLAEDAQPPGGSNDRSNDRDESEPDPE